MTRGKKEQTCQVVHFSVNKVTLRNLSSTSLLPFGFFFGGFSQVYEQEENPLRKEYF